MPKPTGGTLLGDDDIKLPTTGIRADVLEAMRQVWPQYRRRAGLALVSQKRATKILEAAALSLSHQLDRQKQKTPLVNKSIVTLFKAHLELALSQGKESPKTRRVPEAISGITEEDFAALFTTVDDQTAMIIAMRSWGHTWKEIAAMIGISSSNARGIFLQSMRAVFPKRSDKKRPGRKKT
jgi:hypothetical protein